MKNKKHLIKTNTVGLALCVTLLGTLTGCLGYVGGPRVGVDTTFAVQDDYVYYPQYECYYSVSRHQYAYRDGNTWVARSAPRGVSADVVQASPSVRMAFHDSPAQHHAMVVKQYPKNWKPADAKPGQDRKDDQNDHH